MAGSSPGSPPRASTPGGPGRSTPPTSTTSARSPPRCRTRGTRPLAGRRPLQLPEPEALVRAFLDAVADSLPRTPAAAVAAGRPFAAREPQRVPGIQDWAAQVAAGADTGVGISLRLDLSSFRLFDAAEEADTRRAGAAVVQVHSLADPTLVTDAGQLWAGTAAAGFGPRARIDAVLALRRAARVWPPLLRVLDQPVPDALALSDPELEDLLGMAASWLAAAGVLVHWPRELARTLSATAVVRSTAPGSATDGTAFFDAEHLFAFSWELALGGDRLTPGRWTRSPRRTGPSSGCGTSGCGSIRSWCARRASGSWACWTRWTRWPPY